jgi:2-polyprenyl-3-methyl-5-hydroxy-6-metoxy-1,4-benzoquinol methylase
MTVAASFRAFAQRLLWWAAQRAHHVDFAWVLPVLARLPLTLAYRAAHWRGLVNARTGRDWRSMALGRRHIRSQSLAGYRLLPVPASEETLCAWCAERFIVEAREELEAQFVAAGRVNGLSCAFEPSGAALVGHQRSHGLVLLTPHFDSFFLGVAFLARNGAKVNLMSSAVTQQPGVDTAVTRHFFRKYRGLEHYLNGGKVLDMETGLRQFYRLLERGETLVVLGDAPVLPDGVSAQVNFLGANRLVAGGALRMAQRTGSDIGAYVCRHLEHNNYALELGPVGPADEPASIDAVYAFLGAAIQSNPGHWWGADLLVNLPPVVEIQTAVSALNLSPTPRTDGNLTLPTCEVVFFVDSVLQGTEELAFGIDALKAQLSNPGEASPKFHDVTRLSAPSPAAFLAGSSAAQVLVVLDPAVVAVGTLRQQLCASLMRSGATCVVSAGRSDATGEWTIDYCTRSELERYVDRRQALPEHAQYRSTEPKLYLLNTELARDFVALHPHCAWGELPSALGTACQLAPRAFVHSYGDYQMSSRLEMLEMLPDSVHRLLDIGGGEGGFARAFAARPGAQACLLEPGAIAAQRARDLGVTVFERRVEALDPTEVGLFDAVTFLDVLEHLERPIDALRRVRSVLQPGGYVLVSVPNVGFWPIVRDLLIGRFDYLPVGILCNTHLRFFTERSLLALLNEAGFAIVQVRRQGQPVPTSMRARLDALNGPDCPIDWQSLETDSLHVLAALR